MAYYRQHIGASNHILYADRGLSGSNMERDDIQRLIADVRAGKIDIVVIYSYDRVSREIFDGINFFDILEQYDVELHCARSNRRFTKEDAARASIEAANDLQLRRDRSMAGLDDLVTQKDGGIPWGHMFGYTLTRRKGRPDIHPVHSDTVRRIFREIVTMTAEQVAQGLTDDGIENPSGGFFWNASTVLMIAHNIGYAGRINYRKTSTVKKPRDPNDPFKKRKLAVIRNQPWKWTRGSHSFGLITLDEYKAAKLAIASRRRHTGSTLGTTRNSAIPLFGSPTCECAVAQRKQHYGLIRSDETFRYVCSIRQCGGRCGSKVGESLPGVLIEEQIFDAIAPLLESRLAGFDRSLENELRPIAARLNAERASVLAKIQRIGIEQGTLLELRLQGDHSSTALDKKGSELKTAEEGLTKSLARLPTISVDAIDFDGVRDTLRSAFVLLRNRIPLVPAEDDDKELAAKLARGVLEIVVARNDRPAGVVGLRIKVQWARYFLSDEQLEACAFEPETITKDFILPFRFTGQNTGSMDVMADLAASGLHALTDRQWDLIAHELPDLTATDHNGTRPTETRTVVNSLLFVLRTGMPLGAIPPFFGDRKEVYNATNRLISAGGLETLVRVLGDDNAGFLEGLDLEKLANRPRATDHSKVARVATRPTDTAARLADEGTAALSDEQWDAIAGCFDPRIEAPNGNKHPMLDARTAMEGILIKLRTHVAWNKMPAKFGDPDDLPKMAKMVRYHGAWDAAIEVLMRDHSDLLVGLDTGPMDCLPRSILLRRILRRNASKGIDHGPTSQKVESNACQ